MRFKTKPLLLAAVALLVAMPVSAVAGKPAKASFKIRITAEGPCTGPQIGSFNATGAISGSGSATVPDLYYYGFTVVLDGADGSLSVVVGSGWTTFEIVGGTGAYANLSGGGSASVGITWLYPKGTTGKDKRYGDGCGPEGCWCLAPANGLRVSVQLEGILTGA